MPQDAPPANRAPDAYHAFEESVLAEVRRLSLRTTDPSRQPIALVVSLIITVVRGDDEQRRKALGALKHLHRVYQWIRTFDDNWTNPKRPKRVLTLKAAHLPSWVGFTLEEADALWPVMPFASLVYERLRADLTAPVEVIRGAGPLYPGGVSVRRVSRDTDEEHARLRKRAETLVARTYEYAFVLSCTQPTRKLAGAIYGLAQAVIRPMRRTFRALNRERADEVAEAVMESFLARRLSVARYVARASTIDDALVRARTYMVAAIRRRAQAYLRPTLDQQVTVPASTERRWRRKHGISVTTPEHEAQIRTQMKERQTRATAGGVSEAQAAKDLGRSRSVVHAALLEAERRHGLVVERDADGRARITGAQLRRIEECLPAPRRKRKTSSSTG